MKLLTTVFTAFLLLTNISYAQKDSPSTRKACAVAVTMGFCAHKHFEEDRAECVKDRLPTSLSNQIQSKSWSGLVAMSKRCRVQINL